MENIKAKLSKMIRLLLLTVTVVMCHIAATLAQDRVNREKISFSESSETLKEATGWAYNKTLGEWVDYTNLINASPAYKTKSKSLVGYIRSQTPQNFSNLQFHRLVVNNNIYYVLVINRLSGRYRYPAIREDWIVSKETVAFIIDEDSYESIFNETGIVEIRGRVFSTTSGVGDEFLAGIFNTVTGADYTSRIEWVFQKLVTEDGSKVRFRLPESSLVRKNFEENYFETSKEEFLKLKI